MFTIGITGPTGAGKTSALRALKALGALVLDGDAIYHELLASSGAMRSELDARFPGILTDGAIDRKKLGGIVFADPEALLDLNAITHKYVTEETDRRLAEWAAGGGKIAAVDGIALIESGRAKKCDVVVGVISPRERRISRIVLRDGITPEQAERRINAQKPDSFYEENCGRILRNTYNTAEEFEEKCKAFFIEITGGF